jgi:hypothetical protein
VRPREKSDPNADERGEASAEPCECAPLAEDADAVCERLMEQAKQPRYLGVAISPG